MKFIRFYKFISSKTTFIFDILTVNLKTFKLTTDFCNLENCIYKSTFLKHFFENQGIFGNRGDF